MPVSKGMREYIKEFDWSKTPLGPLKDWPENLKNFVNMILDAQHPMFVAWGAEMIFIYNDAYIDQILGVAKHPWALGLPFEQVWAEIWHVCGPLTAKVFARAESTYVSDVRLFMKRGDFLEEGYFSFSYNPVRNSRTMAVEGIYCPSSSTTAKVLSERRLKTLSELSSKALLETTIATACATVMDTLAQNSADVPFAMLYLTHGTENQAKLIKSIGITQIDPTINPELIKWEEQNSVFWPVATTMKTHKTQSVSVATLDALPLGLEKQKITEALVLPLNLTGETKPIGFLIAGVNACRKLDADYQSFYEVVVNQLIAAIQKAGAAEAEKKRIELLAEINHTKSIFLSNVSHEFKTPLAIILGALEALSKKPNFSDWENNHLNTIRNSASRLTRLVNSLLDFSQAENKRIQPVYEATNLTNFTRNILNIFKDLFQTAGLEFINDIETFNYPVFVDKRMYETIIYNLISNAFKNTKTGRISVSLKKYDTEVRLQVTDTGVGIPSEEIPKLFSRFYRIENANARSHEGTGIGLALIQEFIKFHGGKITVSSELGKGSTFTVTFPLGNAHLPAQQIGKRDNYEEGKLGQSYLDEATQWLTNDAIETTPPPQGSALRNTNEITKNKHILVVDDNRDMRSLIQESLNKYWTVHTVSDGEVAFNYLKHHKIDLVVSDIMMPKINGLELLALIRKDAILKTTPFIIFSARSGERDKADLLKQGADDYLVKTTSLSTLVLHVETLLKNTELRKIESYRNELEQLIATLCHGLRNPLNGIVGTTEAMLQRLQSIKEIMPTATLSYTADMEEDLRTVERASQQATQILDEVLELSNLTNHNIELKLEIFNLTDLVSKALKIAKPQLLKKNIRQEVALPREIILLKADTNLLTRIIINLVTNAIANTPRDGLIKINSTVNKISPTESELLLTVTDTGAGLSAEEQLKLFKPFPQIKPSTDDTENLGLGPVISKNLIEKMGGKIQVQSERGKGTKFSFAVKCANLTATEQPEFNNTSESLPTSASLSLAKQFPILVVEDNLMNQKILTKLLTKLGFAYETANDGVEAVAKFTPGRFSIILMDIEMPNKNGLEATKEIRAIEQKNKAILPVIIIAVTANALKEQKELALQPNMMNDYLTKPYKEQQLLEKITRNLSQPMTYSPQKEEENNNELEGATKKPTFWQPCVLTTKDQAKLNIAKSGFQDITHSIVKHNYIFDVTMKAEDIILIELMNQKNVSILTNIEKYLKQGPVAGIKEIKIEANKLVLTMGDKRLTGFMLEFLKTVRIMNNEPSLNMTQQV